MNWYLAKIVFQILCGEGNHTAQFDEQLRLIQAGTKQQAFEKAAELGRREQEVFININQEKVHWNFVNVSEIYRISDLIDGAELYSRIEEKEDGAGYQRIVHRKAELIQSTNTLELLQLA